LRHHNGSKRSGADGAECQSGRNRPIAILLAALAATSILGCHAPKPSELSSSRTNSSEPERQALPTASAPRYPRLGINSANGAFDLSQVEIYLHRTPCFRDCPVYSLTIHGSGEGIYLPGRATAKWLETPFRIEQDAILSVLDQFEAADFFHIEQCDHRSHDASSEIITLRIGSRGRCVSNLEYSARPDSQQHALVHADLRAIARAIDDAANVEQWIGTPSEPTTSELPWLLRASYPGLGIDGVDGRPDLSRVEIRLERTRCYGTCPVYDVTIDGDGNGVYVGRHNVLLQGRICFHVQPSVVGRILDQFEASDFFSIEQCDVRYPCSDIELVTLRVGSRASCIENAGPHEEEDPEHGQIHRRLSELASFIDSAVTIDRWIGTDAERSARFDRWRTRR
jgi:hypothetical protein